MWTEKNDGGISAPERLAYVALKCPSGKFVDASVMAWQSQSAFCIGRTRAVLGGLAGSLELCGHLPHYVGRVGWVLEGGQEHGQLILLPG